MQTIKKYIRPLLITLVLAIAPFIQVPLTDAAQITSRSITLSDSNGGDSGVTYTLNTAALPTTGTAVQSVDVQFCASLTGGACSGGTPTGFSSAASSLASQPTGLGAASGWTVNTGSAGDLRISDASNSTNPSGAVAIVWNGVHNPTANNTTFYAVVTTYSGSNWSTGPLDTGNVALSTASSISVGLAVNEALTFCTGTTITGTNCGSASGNTVTLADGSTTATSTGTSLMVASTNGSSGYTINVSGTTLTSGAHTISALTSGGTSSIGTSQYGLNLMNNTTPTVGAAASGGSGAAFTNYNTANTFRFNPSAPEEVANSTGPSDSTKYTVSYIANIAGSTAPGNYQSNLNYVATANF